MYCIVWEYQVSKDQQSKFEEEYGRKGVWFRFYEPCDFFLGHDLLKDNEGGRYLVIDKWMGQKDYDTFLGENSAQYENLNQQTRHLYEEEIQIGSFDLVG